jgi:hypothetical protein
MAGVLTWKKGWGNSHKHRANEYQFHEAAMEALVAQQKADRGNPTEVSDESSLGLDEIPLRPEEISVGGAVKAHSVVAKVSVVEGPSNKTSQLSKGGRAPLLQENTATGSSTAKQAHVKEGSSDEISSESSACGISSIPCAVPPELTLGEVFPQLNPANQEQHYRLTNGTTSAEQLRVAVQLMGWQTLTNEVSNS